MRMFQGLVPVLGLDGIVAFCLSLMLLWELRNLERDLRPSKYRQPVNVVQDRYAQGEISLRELEQRVGEILEHSEYSLGLEWEDWFVRTHSCLSVP